MFCPCRKSQSVAGSNFAATDGPVVLYTGQNFTGTTQVLDKAGVYNWCKQQLTVGNDTIRSVKVKPGWKATLHLHCNATAPYGNTLVLTKDTPVLVGELDHNASGVTVEWVGGPVVLYTGQNFTGDTQVIDKEGVFNWCKQQLTVGNDTIRSVKVEPGWKVTLHKHCTAAGPNGPTLVLTASSPILKGELDKNASVVTVERDGPVVLYTGQNFTGDAQVLDKTGVFNWCTKGLAIGNDVIRSVKVKPGWKATLHMHCNNQGPYGATLALTENTPILKGELDKNASGVTVEKLGPVVLYTGQNFTGSSQVLDKEGVFNWCNKGLAIGNDTIRSVLVAPGWKVTLHKHCTATGPNGPTLVLTANSPILKGELDKNASVVTVERDAPVVLYAGQNYTGVSQVIEQAGVYNWCKQQLTIGNDVIRSVKVKPGYKVTLHLHCNAQGPYGSTLVLTANAPTLQGELDKNASAVTVEKVAIVPVAPAAIKTAKVVLYTGQNYTGNAQAIEKEGVYNWCTKGLAIGNDVIRSVKVKPGYKVTLHMHCNAQGPYGSTLVLTADTPVLKGELDKNASGVTVEKVGPVVLYTGQNFSGNSQVIDKAGVYNWCKQGLAIGNDTIRSVRVNPGWKVTLHKHCSAAGPNGATLVLTADSPILVGELDKNTSVVTVEKIVPVVLYTGQNFTGNSQAIDKAGVYNWCKQGLTIGNDVIRSVKVAPGWKVTLHMHCNAQGPYGSTLVLTADAPVLKGELDKNASGVTVEKVPEAAKPAAPAATKCPDYPGYATLADTNWRKAECSTEGHPGVAVAKETCDKAGAKECHFNNFGYSLVGPVKEYYPYGTLCTYKKKGV